MKPVKLFYLKNCPFCRKALTYIDSLKAAGRKISKVQRPRPTNFYFTARPSASAREVEVVATDRFGRRYSERIALGHAD